MAFEPPSLQVNLSSSNSSRKLSFMSFDDGTVGLGIVAAMLVGNDQPPPPPLARVPSSILMSSAVAEPKRPLLRGVPSSLNNFLSEEEDEEEEEEEDSSSGGGGGGGDDDGGMEIDDQDESYTFVTSYVGGEVVSRTVYFDDGTGCIQTKEHFISLKSKEAAVVFSIADPSSLPPFQPQPGFGFLSTCSLCSKKLDGKDIFMFRENPFCSKECRYQSVLDDKNLDECTLEVLKPSDRDKVPCDKSLCSDPMASAGVALQLNIASPNNFLGDI